MGRTSLARGGCSIEKQGRDWWAIIVGVIVLMFASALFGQSETNKGIAAPPGSTYNPQGSGASAIYEVLAKENQALRWERSYDRLATAGVDRLLVWQPHNLSADEWTELTAWVADGHTAILAVDPSEAPGGADLPAQLTVTPGAEADTALPAAVHPALRGVEAVAVGETGFALERQDVLAHLVRTDGRPVLLSWEVGKGRIWWSADSSWLTNDRIGQANNLELALGLLVPAEGKKTAFDEFHHGYQSADRWWQLLRGPLQLFLLQLIVAAGFFFWAYGTRFGAPRPLPDSPPRAAAEYVYSMSQLYRRARARRVALEALYRSLTRELGRVIGGTHGLTHAEIARRAAEQSGLPAERIQAALDQTSASQAKPPAEKQLIALAREVEAIQRGVRNAGYRDQRAPGAGSD